MRLARAGGRVLCSPEPAAMVLPSASLREFLAAGHRWTLMLRVCAPGRFLLALPLQGPAWGWLWFAVELAAGRLEAGACLAGPGVALLHVATAAWVARRRGPEGIETGYAWLRPVVDLLGPVFWLGALLWPRITWRGHRYIVDTKGLASRLPSRRGSP